MLAMFDLMESRLLKQRCTVGKLARREEEKVEVSNRKFTL